tara:strand:- start:3118 stop:3390 length:273 start_codon:yes stop_codon:yes gene_type:complete
MKSEIHPKYVDTIIQCACGHKIETRSTALDIHVEICSNCHPFYTGKQKLVDTAGRIDKFNRKFKKVRELKAQKAQPEQPLETVQEAATSK